MKINKNIIYSCLFFLGLTSCKKDFLDRSTIQLPEEKVFGSEVLAQQYADNAYTFMINDYVRFDDHRGSTAQASDEAVSGRNENSVRTLTQGVYFEHATTPATNDIRDVYTNSYAGIRFTNVMLSKINQVPWVTPGLANRIAGEMHFLRAFFYFELIKRFGGVVLIDRPYGENENIDLPRNTYQECLNFILADLDQADGLLPADYPIGMYGRATLGASKALRSRALLFAASKLNNPTNDLTKWQAAANAAKAVMDLNLYSLQATYSDILNVPQSTEYIMVKVRGPRAIANFRDGIMSPGSGGSVGQVNPTQNHVDLYEMKATGRPITDPASGYDPTKPYTGRDPRLSFNVLYNGITWQSRQMGMWTQTAANGVVTYGADYRPNDPTYTATGYYSRKMWPEVYSGNTTNQALLNYVYFRYAEILLNYAEAQNEVNGPDASVLSAINQIRTRAEVNMPQLQITNPTGPGYVAPNKDAMRERIRNERAVELAFEDFRWYDIMRWDNGTQIVAAPMYGMSVTKNPTTGAFTYTKTLLRNDLQKIYLDYMHLYPIPRTEINKSKGILMQNPGWN
ncbi:RagB/SusD family nutrient uptake outer membrane protein [Pelobium sp.]|nr:RagB/SusD family nutrient uptake outer membrane protein [Pelobium sp.]MDA9555563.1 RagB/SusD family nutrient uptake outer membrane protein [Pelobium sp.]